MEQTATENQAVFLVLLETIMSMQQRIQYLEQELPNDPIIVPIELFPSIELANAPQLS